MTVVAIALGSNLGDRVAHLNWAVEALAAHVVDMRVSGFVDTEPVGVPDVQPPYLNAALVGTTALGPDALLTLLLHLEAERGRQRRGHLAARTLDLDLILYGAAVINRPGLVVPHPRFRERLFVLQPLAEVGTDLVDPVTGQSIAALLARRLAAL